MWKVTKQVIRLTLVLSLFCRRFVLLHNWSRTTERVWKVIDHNCPCCCCCCLHQFVSLYIDKVAAVAPKNYKRITTRKTKIKPISYYRHRLSYFLFDSQLYGPLWKIYSKSPLESNGTKSQEPQDRVNFGKANLYFVFPSVANSRSASDG